jgi:hypothetical protein
VNYGYIKVSRKAYAEDPFWLEARTFSKWESWEDCIQMASWKARKFAIGHAVELVERGEFVASLRFLAERWGWDKMTVSRYLDAAVICGRLKRQREVQGGSVYLLVNYEKYQGDEHQTETPSETPRETPERQQRDKTEAVKASNRILADLVAKGLDTWKAQMGGTLPFARVRKAWKALLDDYTPAEILERWTYYFEKNQRAEDRRYVSPENFAQRIALYAAPTEMELTDDFGVPRIHRKNSVSGAWEVAS